MKSKLMHYIKRLKLKFYIWTKRSSIAPTYEEDIISYEKVSFKICLKLIKHIDSEFMIAPISDKKYIRNEELDIFISLYDRKIDITNHIYHYSVKLNERDWDRINFIFNKEADKRRLEMESQVNSQIKNSLHDILERITKI
jgi:hypothetical protein